VLCTSVPSSVFRPTEVREANLSNRYIREKVSRKEEKFTLVGCLPPLSYLSCPSHSPNGSRLLNKLRRAEHSRIRSPSTTTSYRMKIATCREETYCTVLHRCKIFSSQPIKPPSLCPTTDMVWKPATLNLQFGQSGSE
jgi:hypothetical protein